MEQWEETFAKLTYSLETTQNKINTIRSYKNETCRGIILSELLENGLNLYVLSLHLKMNKAYLRKLIRINIQRPYCEKGIILQKQQ